MTALGDPEIREETLLYLLPRVYPHRQEIRAAIEAYRNDRSDAHTLGLRLASRLPELEAIAAALGGGPEAVERYGVEAGLSPQELAETRNLTAMVSDSPALSDAVQSVFPVLAVPDTPPLLAVLAGDPLVDEKGRPVRPNGQPRWRIPWTEIERRLRRVVKRAKRKVEVEVHPATWARALEVVPRARYLVILCHGSPDALLFEEGLGARTRRVGVSDDIPLLFAKRRAGDNGRPGRPELALVLACHGAPAAQAIALTGVPLAVGIAEQEPLHWPDAVALSEAFFAAFLNGSGGELAFRQAAENTRSARKFEIFRGAAVPDWAPPVPRGKQQFPPPPRQEESPRPGFVGREQELARLLEAVERPGLSVIRGAPGQGKTELAQALLERCRLAGFPSAGSLFINLEDARAPEQIVQAAAALVPGPGGRALPSPERVGRALGSEERLLVLDNAEDAAESQEGRAALGELIGGILAAGKARGVVTTRTKLGWPGPKTEVRLEPLATDAEAVALLCGVLGEALGGEARRRWRELVASDELSELIAQLGRHPLSLRLAAVLLADGQSPREVLRDLAETGSLDETAEAEDRLGSLRASLELSRRSLADTAPGAMELWRLLADLPAGIPEETELAGKDRQHLRILRERHLVERRRDGIECLPPVRFFLRHHVEKPRKARSMRIAAACGAALVETIPKLADRFDMARLEDRVVFSRWLPTIDHLLCAPAPRGSWRFDLLAAAAHIAGVTGLALLGWRWCKAASWSKSPDIHEAAAHCQAGTLAIHLGQTEEAISHLETALETFQKYGQWSWEASTQIELGQVAQYKGHFERARAAYQAAMSIYRSAGDRRREGQAHDFLGRLALVKDRLAEARTHFEVALRLNQEGGSRLIDGNVRRNLGNLNRREGRLFEARTQYEAALAAFREIGHPPGEAETRRQLGNLARDEDRFDEARSHYEAALDVFRAIGYPFGEADTLGNLGSLAQREGRPEDARAHFETAFQIARRTGYARGQANARRWLGELALSENRHQDARPHFEGALQVYRDLGRRTDEVGTLYGLAVALLQEEPRRALEIARQAADLAVLIQHHLGASAALSVAARALLALDEPNRAIGQLLGARYHARQGANRSEEANALQLLAPALVRGGADGAFAQWVGLAGAVLAKRVAGRRLSELAQTVDELEASGQAETVLEQVDEMLDQLTEESLPDWLSSSTTSGS